jgi:serine/threonine-protein kinase RsbW
MWQSKSLTHLALLEIPAEAGYVQLARLVASGIAGRLDFNIDEIEDLRIAVDECCVALISCADIGASLQLRYSWDTTEVMLQAKAAAAGASSQPRIEGITGQILAAVVDHYVFGRGDSDVFFELRKRRTPVDA